MSPAIQVPPAVHPNRIRSAAGAILVKQSKTGAAGSRQAVIPIGSVRLKGTLAWPSHPSGFVLVIPARPSKEPRPGERRLATRLRAEGLGTLLISRAIGPEPRPEQIRAAIEWLSRQPEAAGLPMGCLIVGSAGREALGAAASSARISAVVSYERDPGPLDGLLVPTLVIVGEEDYERLRLAQPALVRWGGPALLTAIPGVGTPQARGLEEAGLRASQWFVYHLVMRPTWQAVHSHA